MFFLTPILTDEELKTSRLPNTYFQGGQQAKTAYLTVDTRGFLRQRLTGEHAWLPLEPNSDIKQACDRIDELTRQNLPGFVQLSLHVRHASKELELLKSFRDQFGSLITDSSLLAIQDIRLVQLFPSLKDQDVAVLHARFKAGPHFQIGCADICVHVDRGREVLLLHDLLTKPMKETVLNSYELGPFRQFLATNNVVTWVND